MRTIVVQTTTIAKRTGRLHRYQTSKKDGLIIVIMIEDGPLHRRDHHFGESYEFLYGAEFIGTYQTDIFS
jgi:hypothetical protein